MITTNLCEAQIIYVSVDGTGTGTSWSDAIGDLQAAISMASSGDEIWISAGVYYPLECDPCTENQRTISFEVPTGVALYGGFTGNETTLQQRDWETNLTILSGDIDRNNIQDGNAETVVYLHHVSEQTILDGLIIEQGYAVLPNGPVGERFNSGAAIYNSGVLTGSTSHPVIRNCTFRNNYAAGFGGAIFNNGAFGGSTNMQFDNCIFLNNEAGQGGGAIYNDASFNGVIDQQFSNCHFANNTSSWQGGGAIINQGSQSGSANTSYSNCQFTSNTTTGHGGAILNIGRTGICNSTFVECSFENNNGNFGGAVANNGTLQGVANASVSICNFENNYASGDGGALYNWGTEGESNAYVIESTFRENHTQFAGAGIFNNGIDGETKATILNCQFIENVADTYGAAIYNNGRNGDASAEVANCLFLRNAASSAGAIYNLGSEGGNSSPHITNCTFYGNTANVGGAIYSNANDSTGTANPVVTNCIFWNNTADFGAVFRNIESTTIVRHSVVDKSNCEALFSGTGAQIDCGDGVLFDLYPMFVDTTNENLRLSAESPMLDMGDNSVVQSMGLEFDLDHHSRIINATVDLGAYEYTSSFLPLVITQQPPTQLDLCQYTDINLSFEIQGSGPYSFQWFRNATLLDGATAQTLSLSSLENSGNYYCVVASPYDTVTTDNTILTVITAEIAQLSISSPDTNICEGASISATAIWENAGLSPTVHWYRNNQLIATNVSTINVDNLEQGEVFYVELISDASCALEDTIVSEMLSPLVFPILHPSVQIISSDHSFCEGDTVSIDLDYLNVGQQPIIQWYLNEAPISENVSTLEYNNFTNGDKVYASLIPDAMCTSEDLYWSDTLELTVNPLLTAAINLLGPDSISCLGDVISFDIEYANGGDNPTFAWLINNETIANSNVQTYETNELMVGDVVTVTMVSSAQCLENPLTSDQFLPQLENCATVSSFDFSAEKTIHIFPNPSSGEFQVNLSDWEGQCQWQIMDLNGRIIKESIFAPDNNSHSLILTIAESGVFILAIKNEFYHSVSRIVIH